MDPLAALHDAEPRPYWLDDPARPAPLPPLRGRERCSLAVIGGGFSGLWTALIAKEREPERDVVLLEGARVAWAASGRNGGFCSASLTHGLGNGLARWPSEIEELERLGAANLAAIEAAVGTYGIDCSFEHTGEFTVATADWQLDELAEWESAARALGQDVRLLDAPAMRAEIDSPTYLGGLLDARGTAMVNPARLAWGLLAACLRLGVRVYEATPVRAIRSGRGTLRLVTPSGVAEADQVAWGTGALPGPLRRVRHFVAPVYDYALMTEPLSAVQRAAIGWTGRQGAGDGGNQFHYYRLTDDDRILWGGYDAVYHYGNKVAPSLDQRPETFETLALHFYATFPQLADVRFTHRWGGVIDVSTRFCAFFGRAYGGRLGYVAGYTGLGVGASRFGAEVMLDRLAGEETERTGLGMVRTKPTPFPPEPLRYAAITATRHAIAVADRESGRRGPWLRTLDRLGLGSTPEFTRHQGLSPLGGEIGGFKLGPCCVRDSPRCSASGIP